MRIKWIELKNFGKLNRKFYFKEGGISVYYGENEKGKTTLFRAIQTIFFGFSSVQDFPYKNDYGDVIELSAQIDQMLVMRGLSSKSYGKIIEDNQKKDIGNHPICSEFDEKVMEAFVISSEDFLFQEESFVSLIESLSMGILSTQYKSVREVENEMDHERLSLYSNRKDSKRIINLLEKKIEEEYQEIQRLKVEGLVTTEETKKNKALLYMALCFGILSGVFFQFSNRWIALAFGVVAILSFVSYFFFAEQIESEVLEDDAQEGIIQRKEQIDRLKQKRRQSLLEYEDLLIERTLLEKKYKQYAKNESSLFLKKASEYFKRFSGGAYQEIVYDENFNFVLIDRNKHRFVLENHLSQGTKAQLYLALRFAIIDKIGVSMPIIFDEAFVYWDDKRTGNFINILRRDFSEYQIIIFTAHHLLEKFLDQMEIFSLLD